MNQVADILKLASEAQQQGVDAVLATVVRTEGSAYRRAGAMMLICEDGRSVGMISGGCLEPHIIKRAFWLTRRGATVQTYQTGDDIEYAENGQVNAADKHLGSEDELYQSDDEYELDDALNFGLGCNGRVHVLFERLETAAPLLEKVRQTRRTHKPTTIATLVRVNHDQRDGKNNRLQSQAYSDLRVGMRINLDTYSNSNSLLDSIMTTPTYGSVTDTTTETTSVSAQDSGVLTGAISKLARHQLADKNTDYVMIDSDHKNAKAENHDLDSANNVNNANNVDNNTTVTTEWLVQRLQPQIRLLICGAGNDVMPLVTMAKLQDWHVTVIDSRSQYATRTRFPQADVVMTLPLEDYDTLLTLSQNAAVALMSHSLTQDRARLAVLLMHPQNYKYLGQLGPQYRTERLIAEIGATIQKPAALEAGIEKLHYPIGYKLGGDGPEALALGIMAQINAVMYDKESSATSAPRDALNPVALNSRVMTDMAMSVT